MYFHWRRDEGTGHKKAQNQKITSISCTPTGIPNTGVGSLYFPKLPAGSVSERKPLGKSTRRSPGVLCRALRL